MAVVGVVVLGLGMEGEGWGERAAMLERAGERRQDRALLSQRGKVR